jgi:hypothetical protein
MKIGFLDNQINERGATLQVFLYATYARDILGHSVAIVYPNIRYMYDESVWTRRKNVWLSHVLPRYRRKMKVPFDQKMADRIVQGGIELKPMDLDGDFSQFDALYHYKHGSDDAFRPRGTRYWVHACSSHDAKAHGDRYVAVSKWLGRLYHVPYVPHLVECANETGNLRQELGIPSDAFVFARYGGRSTFDLPWAWDVISQTLAQSKNIYFLFANTDVKLRHERILDLPTIYDPVQKRRFINTSDAMLHAREGGEAFGIAVGEFARCSKRILTYGKSAETAHIEMLRNPVCYNNAAELKHAIDMVASGDAPPEDGGEYQDCTPEKVMKMFDEAFVR